MLTTRHAEGAVAPLVGPSDDGVFPDANAIEPLCVVPDTHWLGFDINYACAKRCRTTLVAAANRQLIRVFCAQHVIDEIYEHVERWSANAQRTVAVDDYLDWFIREYAPVLRVIPDDAIPTRWLSPNEQARIENLARKDRDDIPSVKLALVTRGLYMSKDKDALHAVYGANIDRAARDRWLVLLKTGSDAGELARFMRGAQAVGFASSYGAAKLAQKAYNTFGGAAVVVGGGVALVIWHWISKPERSQLRKAISDVLGLIVDVELERTTQHEHFHAALPRIPTWNALATTNDTRDVLGRAAIYTLARDISAHVSARELAERMRVPGSRSETQLRELLRATPCFVEVRRGRWQLGAAIT